MGLVMGRFNKNTRLEDINASEPHRIALMRNPDPAYSIDTEDNPDMVEFLKGVRDTAQDDFSLSGKPEEERAKFIAERIQTQKNRLKDKAVSQHNHLKKRINQLGILQFTQVQEKTVLESSQKWEGATDEVFATDSGKFFFNGELNFMPANFSNQQRFGEERLVIGQAVSTLGAKTQYLSDDEDNLVNVEGGDIRQAPGRKFFFVGYGHRNASLVPDLIEERSKFTVLAIELLQPKYYHLDCCFLPLPNDNAMIYEGDYVMGGDNKPELDEATGWPKIVEGTATMTQDGRAQIRQLYDSEHLILITEKEAANFGTNSALLYSPKKQNNVLFVPCIEDTAHCSLNDETLAAIEKKAGVIIEKIPYNAYHPSGGSVRCTIQEVPCSKEWLANVKRKSLTTDSLVRGYGVLFKEPKKPKDKAKQSSQKLFDTLAPLSLTGGL